MTFVMNNQKEQLNSFHTRKRKETLIPQKMKSKEREGEFRVKRLETYSVGYIELYKGIMNYYHILISY